MRLIWWIIKRLVTFAYRKDHFYTHSWGVDEFNDIHIISEEWKPDSLYHRNGILEETE